MKADVDQNAYYTLNIASLRLWYALLISLVDLELQKGHVRFMNGYWFALKIINVVTCAKNKTRKHVRLTCYHLLIWSDSQ